MRPGPVGGGTSGEAEARKAGEQPVQDDLEPETGQVLTEALVDAVTERNVAPAVAVDVEDLGVGEDLRVVVGGTGEGDQAGSDRDGRRADLDVGQRDTGGHHVGDREET